MFSNLFYSGPSFDVLFTDYAQKGRIDDNAPIKAQGEIIINAPIDKVWAKLVDLAAWPQFDPTFSDVVVESQVAVGAKASFKLKGFPIAGTFAVVTPNRELTWVGTSLWTKAIDRHVVEALPDGTTRLRMEESLAGLFVPLMFSSARLEQQHQAWLAAIKAAVEASEASSAS